LLDATKLLCSEAFRSRTGDIAPNCPQLDKRGGN